MKINSLLFLFLLTVSCSQPENRIDLTGKWQFTTDSTNNGPALIREAQEQVAHRVDNVGLITTTDIGDPDNIHPAQKAEAGFRLANLVLGRTYKALKKGYETPFFTQMTIEKGKAILSFSHTEKKLVCPDKKNQRSNNSRK